MSAIVIKTRRTGCQVFIENDGLSAKLRVSGCSTGPLNRAEALTIADALNDGRIVALITVARKMIALAEEPVHPDGLLAEFIGAIKQFDGVNL